MDIVTVASKYIGVKYEQQNCIMLGHSILGEFGIDTPAPLFHNMPEGWYRDDPSLMRRHLETMGEPVPSMGDLRALDIVMLSMDDNDVTHVGIMVDNDKFLHICENIRSRLSKISNPFWRSKYRGARRVV